MVLSFIRRKRGEVIQAQHVNELQIAAEQLDAEKAAQTAVDALETEVAAKLPIADVLNEPNMATGATDKPPSQASVVAYVAPLEAQLDAKLDAKFTPTLLMSPDLTRDRGGAISPTITGTVTTVAGEYGDAWSLDSSTAAVSVPQGTRWDGDTGTVIVRGRRAGDPDNFSYSFTVTGDSPNRFYMGLDPTGRPAVLIGDAVFSQAMDSPPDFTESFVHAVRFDTGTVQQIVNGIALPSRSYNGSALGTSDMRIWNPTQSDAPFEVESVLVYRDWLTDEQIATLTEMDAAWTWDAAIQPVLDTARIATALDTIETLAAPSPAYPNAEVIGYDRFNRPNTTTTLGIADSGQSWYNSGSCRVADGAVEFVSSVTRAHPAIQNLHKPDEIEIVIDTPESGDFDAGITWRITHSGTSTATDNLLCIACCKSTDDIKLMKRVGPAYTTIATASNVGWAFDTRYVVTVRDIDDRVSVLVDGVEYIPPTTINEPGMTGHNVGLTFHNTREQGSRIPRLTWRRLVTPRRRVFAKNMAHRGTASGMPENSLVSVAALPRNVDGIEIDVAQTVDGDWVCMHDTTVDRTTNGTGTVSTLTTEYVTGLDITGGGGKVPTLAQMLDAAQTRGFAEVHVDYVTGSLADLVATVEAHAIADRCVIFVGSASAAATVRAESETIRIAVGSITAANADTEVPAAAAEEVELCYLAPGDGVYLSNRAAVATILGAGMAAGASVVNNATVQRTAADDGVTVLLTDYAAAVNV